MCIRDRFGLELAFEAADFIDGVVDEADDVELVEGLGGVGQRIGLSLIHI